MHAPGECPLKTKDGKEGKLVEGQDTSWIDPHARKVERKWKSMNKSARKKWLQTMADKAGDNDTKQEVLDDVLDDYGLTEELTPNYTDLRGDGDEGTTTSDPDKDYGLHQFSDPKYVPAYTDQSFQTAPDKTGIGQNLGDKQSGTPKKAKGQATAAKSPAKVDAKGGMDKPAVGTKSDTPDKATGKATAAKISPKVTTKDGVTTQVESIGMNFVRKVLSKRRQIMSDNTVLGGKPFEDLRSVADAALKIMTGQPQEVKEEEEEKEVTKEDQPQELTE